MPTISANTSAQVTLPAGQYINGTGAGFALVGTGAAGADPLTAGDAWQIGPFLTQQTVHFTAQTLLDYDIRTPLAAPPVGLTATQTAATQDLVSGAGIRGIGGQTFTYDGDALPDPRLQTTVSFVAAGDAETTDYLQNGYGLRRIVIALASQTTNSAITESAGGQSLTVVPNAAAAGFRWVNSVTHPQNMTTQADSSVGIIDILGA